LDAASGRENRKILKVYTIVEKPNTPKGIWLEIGVGSENRDGSISAKLDALPVNGTIHLREYEKKTENSRPHGDNKRPSQGW
jgi:hypothetical protein